MTVTSSSRTSYDVDPDNNTDTCEGCLTETPADELRDCGSHTLCPGCLASSPCSACSTLRRDETFDRAEQAAYDAWRDLEAIA